MTDNERMDLAFAAAICFSIGLIFGVYLLAR